MRIRGHITLICLVCIVIQWTTITCQSTIKRSADVDENENTLPELLVEIKNTLNAISGELQFHKETTNAQHQYTGQKLEEIERKLQEINETSQSRISDAIRTLNTSIQSVQSAVYELTTTCSRKRLDSSE